MATKTLLINKKRLLEYTTLNGSVDFDKLQPHIYNSQILNLEPILGSNLYKKLIADVTDNTISGAYKTLLDDYVTPSLVFFTMEHYISFSNYEIANSGISTNSPDGGVPTATEEITRLVQRYRSIADKYSKKLDNYLCDYKDSFSELSEPETEIKKVAAKYRVGWVLGKSYDSGYERNTGQGY